MSDASVKYDFCLLTDLDTYLFKQGNHFRLYEKHKDQNARNQGYQG